MMGLGQVLHLAHLAFERRQGGCQGNTRRKPVPLPDGAWEEGMILISVLFADLNIPVWGHAV